MKNIPIVGKFIAIMAVFGIFSIGVAFYTGSQLKSIDTSYSNLLEGESSAALYLARSNRSMQNMRGAIADMVLLRSPELSAAADKELQTAKESFGKFIDSAAKAVPSNTDIPALKAAVLKVIDEACGNAIAAGRAASDEASVVASQNIFLNECQPQFAVIGPKFTEVTSSLTDAAMSTSASLSDETNAAARNSLLGVLAGVAIVLGMRAFGRLFWSKPFRGRWSRCSKRP